MGIPKGKCAVSIGVFRFEPAIVFACGGPAATDDDLIAAAEGLVALARECAEEASWGFISFESAFHGLTALQHPEDPKRWPKSANRRFAVRLCDELVADAYPYQILGPGHLERLSHEGVSLTSAADLGGGKVELAVGSFSNWLLDSPARPAVQDEARSLLSPCMVSDEVALARYKERRNG